LRVGCLELEPSGLQQVEELDPGIDAPREVKRIAMISKRNIKRINNPDDLLQMPAAMVTAHNRYNIFVGV
jgi:hypothetical protein